MQSILPKERIAPSRVNPKIALFYGPPKIGKTERISWLEDCLILDAEEGAEAMYSRRLKIYGVEGPTVYKDDGVTVSSTSLDSVFNSIIEWGTAEYNRTGKAPKPPYTFICLDTIDKIEEMCEISATRKYKDSVIGKSFEGKSVLELPKGGGYYHLRNEVMEQINRFASVCEYLILTSHIKETLLNKGGVDVSVSDISLTGKLASMVCAKADIIGYCFRVAGSDKTLMVNFQTFDTTSAMGARFPRLAGKNMEFQWSNIYLPDSRSIGEGGPLVISPHVQQQLEAAHT